MLLLLLVTCFLFLFVGFCFLVVESVEVAVSDGFVEDGVDFDVFTGTFGFNKVLDFDVYTGSFGFYEELRAVDFV